MALGGTYQDFWRDMYKDSLLHELQQMGSVLEQTVMVEPMEGSKNFFSKLGKQDSYKKTARNQNKNYSDLEYERRLVTTEWTEFDTIFDKEDLIKYVSNPQNEVTKSAVAQLGRDKDSIISSAISGNAVVITDGSSSNVALPTASKIDVDDHTYDDATGDVELTKSKIKKALGLIKKEYGLGVGQRVFCVGPTLQIMNLTEDDQIVNGDYRTGRALEGPGVVEGISGYLGITFITYERFGVDASDDELVYMYADDAIKVGIFEPLTVEVDRATTKSGNPDQLSIWESLGATRMYEEKVIQIACNPIS